MKPSAPSKTAGRALPALVASAVLVASLLPAPLAFAQASKGRGNTRGETVTLNFVNAEIEGVARAMSAILKQQFVVDPRVKGAMTLYSDTPLSPREAYVNFLAALRGLGFTVVEVGGLYKIVPEADAKLQTGTVTVGERTNRGGDQVITQVFRLTHENANNLVPVLRPLISPNNTINANPGNNTLVITDYADNLQRIGKIIAAMDTPASGDIEVIALKYAVAADIAALVQRMTDSAGGTAGAAAPGGAPGGTGTASVQVDSRSNSLLVRAPNPARMASIRALIDKLDKPVQSAGAAGNVWVVYLKNADAVKLATVLRAAYGGGGAGSSGSGASSGAPLGTPTSVNTNAAGSTGSSGASTQSTAPLSGSASPSTGGFVQADPSSNSLIITAPEPMYRQLRAVIDQLDSRRAQVYVESLIVEVDPSQSVDFGIQWQGILGSKGDTNVVAGGTNFNSGLDNILNAAGVVAQGSSGVIAAAAAGTLPSAGFNIGLAHKFGNYYTLGALARALDSQTGTNILSTPNLVTLDNEEARIVVGQNVPFVTGQYTNTGTGTSSPFQTIERKDVGITLKIKPQIGENGTVRMTIYQESSSVASTTAVGTDNAGPTTNKRSIESTITVDDGQIIVLGGLIEDSYNTNRSKVPLLGDIPYVGALFRSESRTRKRTNLMVFLRPVVMRDQASSNKISLDRYDYIRAQQVENQPPQSTILRINESPTLPQVRPGDTGPSGAPRPLGDTAPPPPPIAPSIPAPAPLAEPASAPKTN
ncbi:MAG TPA: type II secretion system secretin GspD [Burkholderiaceae bacterium]|nr:type II secretion system secretin GspD [Burkholderiaceae bacterium]